jgi:sensor histidine kinase YesM
MSLGKYLRIVAFSVAGSFAMTYLSCRPCSQSFYRFTMMAMLTSFMWVVMWLGNENLSYNIDRKITWVKSPGKRLIAGMAFTVMFTVVVAIILAKVYEYALNLRFSTYSDFIFSALIITFLISSFMHGREFLLRWREAAVNAERYQKENALAQFESLKSQVDPHFLFNSLNVLTNLVYEDADKSARFIKQLSEVYRYVLETRNKKLVPLSEELKFVNAYLYLQQIRFGNKLVVKNELNGKEGMVPPLVLQVLAENAIKHNVISEEHPLTIHLHANDTNVFVENNFQKKEILKGDSMGIGLDNTKKRYDFLTNEKVKVENLNGKFKVTIPLLQYHE